MPLKMVNLPFLAEFQYMLTTVEKVPKIRSVFLLKIGNLKPVLRWGGGPPLPLLSNFSAEAHD